MYLGHTRTSQPLSEYYEELFFSYVDQPCFRSLCPATYTQVSESYTPTLGKSTPFFYLEAKPASSPHQLALKNLNACPVCIGVVVDCVVRLD